MWQAPSSSIHQQHGGEWGFSQPILKGCEENQHELALTIIMAFRSLPISFTALVKFRLRSFFKIGVVEVAGQPRDLSKIKGVKYGWQEEMGRFSKVHVQWFLWSPNYCLQKELQPDGEQMGTCLWVGNSQSLGSRVEECWVPKNFMKKGQWIKKKKADFIMG